MWGLAAVGGSGWVLGVCASGLVWVALGFLVLWSGVIVGPSAWVNGGWWVWLVVWSSLWAARVMVFWWWWRDCLVAVAVVDGSGCRPSLSGGGCGRLAVAVWAVSG